MNCCGDPDCRVCNAEQYHTPCILTDNETFFLLGMQHADGEMGAFCRLNLEQMQELVEIISESYLQILEVTAKHRTDLQ